MSESRDKIEESQHGGFIRVAYGGASGLGLRPPCSVILAEERLATATLAEGHWVGVFVFGIEGGEWLWMANYKENRSVLQNEKQNEFIQTCDQVSLCYK